MDGREKSPSDIRGTAATWLLNADQSLPQTSVLMGWSASCFELPGRFFVRRCILAPLAPDLHLAPGNHDIGDKPHDDAPAGPVNETTRATYHDAFGRDHWLVEHDGVALVTMKSSLVNAGTDAEAVRRDWLERELMSRRDQREFPSMPFSAMTSFRPGAFRGRMAPTVPGGPHDP